MGVEGRKAGEVWSGWGMGGIAEQGGLGELGGKEVACSRAGGGWDGMGWDGIAYISIGIHEMDEVVRWKA